jgi:hypothetical protein
MKTILKYGIIFTIIYGAVLLALTIFAGRLMPAEVGFIVPLWFLVKPLLISMASLPASSFLLVMVVSQAVVAFIQGAIIGIIVNILSKKNNLA